MVGNTSKERIVKDPRNVVKRGTPQRYQSQGVLRLSQGGAPGQKNGQMQGGEEEPVETEGERQLKALLHKQLETNVSLHQYNKRARQFTGRAVYESVAREVQGECSLPDYKQLTIQHDQKQKFVECGLGDHQIRLLSSNNEKSKREYGADPLIKQKLKVEVEQQLQAKQELLDGSQPFTFAGAHTLNRHEHELEQSLCTTEEQRQLTACLTTHGTLESTEDPLDPANQLQTIVNDIDSGRLQRQRFSTPDNSQDSDGDAEEGLVVAGCAPRPETYIYIGPEPLAGNDKCLACESSQTQNNSNKSECITCALNEPARHPSTSSSQAVSSSTDKRILKDHIEAIPEEIIKRYRLTPEEISKLPRFQNYEPGEPNKVLYLKNLSPRVTEADLVSLFVRYQQPGHPHIEFKLLKGRMKGQAFITFADINCATQALQLVHGYHFKGKPIIIQYGRKQRQ